MCRTHTFDHDFQVALHEPVTNLKEEHDQFLTANHEEKFIVTCINQDLRQLMKLMRRKKKNPAQFEISSRIGHM